MVATEALLDGNQLSLTQLGRNISGTVAPKHNIKLVDRLLGNTHLHTDKITIYQCGVLLPQCPLSWLIGLMSVNNCA